MAVSALQTATAGGDIVTASREDDGSGSAGSSSCWYARHRHEPARLTVWPSHPAYVYEGLPQDQLDGHLPDIFGSGYSVSLFTTWRGEGGALVWIRCGAQMPGHPIAGRPGWF